MKKLVLMAAAIVAVSFASCGNKAANTEKAEGEATEVAAPAEVAADTLAPATVDSAAVAK